MRPVNDDISNGVNVENKKKKKKVLNEPSEQSVRLREEGRSFERTFRAIGSITRRRPKAVVAIAIISAADIAADAIFANSGNILALVHVPAVLGPRRVLFVSLGTRARIASDDVLALHRRAAVARPCCALVHICLSKKIIIINKLKDL